MRLTILFLAAAVAFGVAPRASSAQSLAETAAKEKERRSGKGGKVITESDLGGASQAQSFESETSSDAEAGTPAEGAAAEGAAADKGGPKEKSEDDKRSDKQAALQKELDAERAHIEGIKKDIAVRETELADTSNYLIGGRRGELLKYVDDAKQAIATHEAQVQKLQEQARREGISVR